MGHVACCTQRNKTFSKSFASFETKLDSIFFSFLFLHNPKSNWKVCLKSWGMNVCDATFLVFCSDQFYDCLYLTGSVL